jgi:cytochrome c biogenesis protein CcmG/thiol:disulfide interchange protein DsbE
MNIWASWCVPCRDEHPFLINLSNERNIEIIGLNYKDDVEKAKFFLKKYDSPYKFIFSDIDGTIAINWGAYGVPETYLIYNKKIIKKIVGPLNEVSLIEIKNLIQ